VNAPTHLCAPMLIAGVNADRTYEYFQNFILEILARREIGRMLTCWPFCAPTCPDGHTRTCITAPYATRISSGQAWSAARVRQWNSGPAWPGSSRRAYWPLRWLDCGGRLHIRNVASRRRVVDCERKPARSGRQRRDDLGQQWSRDVIGPFARCRDGCIAGVESVAQARGADPRRNGATAKDQHSLDEQQDEPRAERRSSAAARVAHHWHGAGMGCEDVMARSVPDDGLVWQPPSSRSGRLPSTHPMPDGFTRMAARLPTAKEINVFDSLDERCAVENFLGKNLEQAQALFRENFLHYQEDLMWMGPIAFRFYVPAAINYLLSKDADNDADAASSFCGLIEFRLDYDAAEIAPVGPIIREGILGILKNFDRYECDRVLYGDVAERYRTLRQRLSR
jgi:hypothetical protein